MPFSAAYGVRDRQTRTKMYQALGMADIDKLCQDAHSPFMVTMNISLPSPMKTWAESRAKDGRYSNTSDYVRDLIRKDQEREVAIAELQGLIDEGLKSGPAQPFDFTGFISDRTSKHD